MSMAPMQHEPAAEVAFLVKGMDRDCSYPWNHGQLDGDNIDLMQPNEDSEDGNAWRKNTYTATLVMNAADFVSASDLNEGSYQPAADLDQLSVQVSFDVRDLAEREINLNK
ncbi:hypothetical protein P885DRAFT_62178 [Corynascus similis CBS 632.67]